MKTLLLSNRLLLALAAALVPWLALSQEPADTAAAQRARIAAERREVEALFTAQEKACYGKFAVNDCLQDARSRRRAALADLRRQEISLDDAERRRRGGQRQREIEGRTAPQPKPPGSARGGPDQLERDAQAAKRAADRAAREAARVPRKDAASEAQQRAAQQEVERRRKDAERSRLAADAARNVQRHEERVKQAQQRREALNRRLAERKKPPAKPLPVPP